MCWSSWNVQLRMENIHWAGKDTPNKERKIFGIKPEKNPKCMQKKCLNIENIKSIA